MALGFMVLLALINLRGVGESVKFNVVLTLVEVTALCIVIGVGFYVMARGDADIGEVTVFTDYQDKGLFLAVTAATSIAFFAMVGFEDAVNMVEETHEPERIFPRSMLTGLGIAVILYMLVAVSVVAVLTPTELADIRESEGRALLEVVSKGSPTSRSTGVPVPGLLRGRQHRTDQYADGEPAALRHGQAGRAAADAGEGAARPAYAMDRDSVLDRAVAAADLVRHLRPRQQHRRGTSRARRRSCCCACSRSSTWRASCCAAAGTGTRTRRCSSPRPERCR